MAKAPPRDTPFNRFRARLYRHLPGRKGQQYAKKYRRLMRNDAETQFAAALPTLAGKNPIDWIFCETHETRLPRMASRFAALRRRAAAISHPKINLDWG